LLDASGERMDLSEQTDRISGASGPRWPSANHGHSGVIAEW